MNPATSPPAVFRQSAPRVARQPRPLRAWLLMTVSALAITVGSIVLLTVGVLTLFRARRLYAALARWLSIAVLRMHGIRIRVLQAAPFPARQTVFVSNHSSTLDLFILVAIGLPDCRFFLSGFLRKIVPLGVISWLLGTFFTVPQNRPAERTRIFQRAERTLRSTGESVYLSPEGGRITGGGLGRFNKGAFHLALNLRAPIVPFYIAIPPAVDPVMGFDARAGVVDVHVLPTIETADWRLEDLGANVARVRDVLLRAHEELTCR